MKLTGRCYCGEVHYAFDGDPITFGQCHCRECQYLTGGGANFALMVPESGLRVTQGTPRQFARADLEAPRVRDFCATCGTHLLTRPPGVDFVVLKVGTLDDPEQIGLPKFAIFMCDAQPFHVVAEGVAKFDKRPPA